MVFWKSDAENQKSFVFRCEIVTYFKSKRFTSRHAEIAQLGERQTEDLKVPGSNPENSHEF